MRRYIRIIRNLIAELPSYNFIQSCYYNFKWLPFKQAIHLPILLSNVAVHKSDAEVIIQADQLKYGMIKIGLKYDYLYWINKTTHLELRAGGRMVFKGKCSIGKGSHIELEPNGYLEWGNNTGANCGLNIYSFYKVVIGDNAKIGFEVSIFDSSFHPMRDLLNGEITKTYAPVVVGPNSWIGAKVIIMPGTRLPESTIVSMGSVVSGHYKEPNTIMKGNPAKVVDKGYCFEEKSFYDDSYIVAPKKCYD